MKRRTFLFALPMIYLSFNNEAESRSNNYEIESPFLRVAYNNGRFASYERWLEVLLPYKPKFIVTGTFYDENTGLPIGLIAKDRTVVNQGLFVPGSATLSYAPLEIEERRNPEAETQLGALAWMVREGSIYVRDRKIDRYGAKRRIGVGKKGKKLVIAHSNSDIDYLASYMKDLGCSDAVAVDGGRSAFLYTDRPVLLPEYENDGSRRMLNNLLVGF